MQTLYIFKTNAVVPNDLRTSRPTLAKLLSDTGIRAERKTVMSSYDTDCRWQPKNHTHEKAGSLVNDREPTAQDQNNSKPTQTLRTAINYKLNTQNVLLNLPMKEEIDTN